MIGITFVSGKEYFALAERAVSTFKASTGLDCIIAVGDTTTFRDACLGKIKFLANHMHERFVCFDADVRFLKPFPMEHFQDEGRFYGVMDQGKGWGAIKEDREFYQIEHLPYINGGFYIASPDKHRSIFKRTLELADLNPQIRFNEQTHLNAALCESRLVKVVGPRFNMNANYVNASTFVAHAFMARGASQKRRVLDDLEEKFSEL